MRKLIGVLAGVAVLAVAGMVGVRWMNQPIPASFYDTPPPNARKILWIGNSHTRVHQVPYQVQKVLHEAGAQPVVFEFLWKAQTLEEQLEFPEVQEALEKEWDAIILQEQSYQSVARSPLETRGAIREVGEKNSAPLYFYEVWSYSNIKKNWVHSPALAQAHLDRVACWLRQETGVQVLPAGRAVHEARSGGREVVSPDGNHLALEGALVVAQQIGAGLAPEVQDLVPDWEGRCREESFGVRPVVWGPTVSYLPGVFVTDGETTVLPGLFAEMAKEKHDWLETYGLVPDVVLQMPHLMDRDRGPHYRDVPVRSLEDLPDRGTFGTLSYRTVGTGTFKGIVLAEEVALLNRGMLDSPLSLWGKTRADVEAWRASLQEIGEVRVVDAGRGASDVRHAIEALSMVLEADANGLDTLSDDPPVQVAGYPLER